MARESSLARKGSCFTFRLSIRSLGCLFSGALFLGSLSTAFAADPATVANIDSSHPRLVEYGQNLPPQKSSFKPGAFKPGDSLSFTLSQNLAKTGNAGNSSDSLKAGATFTGTLKGVAKGSVSGSFLSPNGLGTGYNQSDGFGLVDAVNSVEAILQSPAATATNLHAKSPAVVSPEVPHLSTN